ISAPSGAHPAALADAQFAIAREYGFESWPTLKRHILVTQRPADFHEPTWGRSTWEFFMSIYEGHEDRVREMLRDDSSSTRRRLPGRRASAVRRWSSCCCRVVRCEPCPTTRHGRRRLPGRGGEVICIS